MKSESKLPPALRLRKMHQQLEATYGRQGWWPAKTRFEVVIGAYLTQNTSWRAVERSLANLKKYKAMSLDGIRQIPVSELQQLIRPSGFQTRKAPALKAFVSMLDEDFRGSLDRLRVRPTDEIRRRLLALPGVGAETADAILLYALGHTIPMADEYLRRIVERHGLHEPGSPSSYQSLIRLTQDAFAEDIPEARRHLFGEFHALTVAVGKAHCHKVPRCEGCPLASDLTNCPPKK